MQIFAKLITGAICTISLIGAANAQMAIKPPTQLPEQIIEGQHTNFTLVTTNGQNVNSVTHSRGKFVRTGGRNWQERGNDGARFNFVEQGRDQWSVYLRDQGRGVTIQLDLHRKMIIYSDDSGKRFDLYQITSSSSNSGNVGPTKGKTYSCAQEDNLRSINGDVSTNVRFRVLGENDETQFKIYWLDYQGRRQFYKHVFAGEVYNQQTYVTHPWLVTAPIPGGGEQCIAIYTPSAGGRTITLR